MVSWFALAEVQEPTSANLLNSWTNKNVQIWGLNKLDMQHWHKHTVWIWTCSMGIDMQHEHRYVAWTWTCSMDMDMHHGHGHVGFTFSMDKDIQQRHGFAVWMWTCSMDMDMQFGLDVQHGLGHAACVHAVWTWTRTCCLSNFMSMLHVQVYAKRTWSWVSSWLCTINMVMQLRHGPVAWT
jgi:hypothetical protein